MSLLQNPQTLTTMTTGTNYFTTEAAARRYYAAYGYDLDDVKTKISTGEIQIGRPTPKHGETVLVDREGRCHIKTR